MRSPNPYIFVVGLFYVQIYIVVLVDASGLRKSDYSEL